MLKWLMEDGMGRPGSNIEENGKGGYNQTKTGRDLFFSVGVSHCVVWNTGVFCGFDLVVS